MTDKTITFVEKAKSVHGSKYDYSGVIYVNSKTKVIIKCPFHGSFYQRPDSHLAERGCSECDNDSRRASKEEFIKRARLVHGDKYDYSKVEYVNKETKVTITCPLHGDFYQRPGSHLANCGCNKCGEYRTRLTQDEFILKAKQKHGNRYNYDKVSYVNNKTPVVIICPKHGEVKQKPFNHLAGNGCYKCKASKGEILIREILLKHGIKHETEYRIPEVKELFYYDFYLPEYNLLIEFHGKQHYEVIDFFGGKEYLEDTKRRDLIKLSLARDFRIPIIYFNYKHIQLTKIEFEKMLVEILNKIVNRKIKSWFYREY